MNDNISTKLHLNSNPASIYYIHPSENSTNPLSSIKFAGNGFTEWKRSVLITLSARNKLGFLNGDYPKPEPHTPEHDAWLRCNDLIISWLLYSLDTQIAKSVLYFKTAYEIWTDLEERFGYTSGAQLYDLEQQLYELHQGSQSISEYYTKLKVLWDELNSAFPLPTCTCNKCTRNLTQKFFKTQQDQRLIQFLMKVNEHFSHVRSNILMQQPLLPVSHAYRLLVQEEKHKEITNQSASYTDHMAFNAQRTLSFRPYTANRITNGNNQQKFNGSSITHQRHNSSNQQRYSNKKPSSSYYCTHCKIPGHSNSRCFELHSYPSGF